MFKYFFNEFMLKLELKTTQIKIEIRNPQLYTSGIRTHQLYTSCGISPSTLQFNGIGIGKYQLHRGFILCYTAYNLNSLSLKAFQVISSILKFNKGRFKYYDIYLSRSVIQL